jgi:mono/diheme cytochrome c family protein
MLAFKPSKQWRGQMFRVGMLGFASLLATAATAWAQTPVERGQYLVNSILACGNCHTPKTASGEPIAEKELSGGLAFTTPAFDATASNITPDRETGIGTWSDAEIKRAIMEGVRPEHGRLAGVPLAAVMPVNFYKAMLPGDLDAVVAYVRSVKPVRNAVANPVYKGPVHRDAYPDAENGFTEAALRDPVRLGAYLVTLSHCMECHSTWQRGVSDHIKGFAKGGRQFAPTLVKGFPNTWDGAKARNITSHKTSGIGAWSDAEIKRAITQGVRPDGTRLKPPMDFSSYAKMTNTDLEAIVAYLRTVPPLE